MGKDRKKSNPNGVVTSAHLGSAPFLALLLNIRLIDIYYQIHFQAREIPKEFPFKFTCCVRQIIPSAPQLNHSSGYADLIYKILVLINLLHDFTKEIV